MQPSSDNQWIHPGVDFGGGGGGIVFPSPNPGWTIQPNGAFAPLGPFRRYVAQKPADLKAVCLGPANLAEVAWFMLSKGGATTVYIPASRDYVEWGDKEFRLGEWIIYEERGVVGNFRVATAEERDTYAFKEIV